MAIKTVTYELFDYRWSTSNWFMPWQCDTIWKDSFSLSAIKDYLYSAKVKLYTGDHELHFYFKPEGADWQEVGVVKKGETKEFDITSRIKASPQFELKAELCYGVHLYSEFNVCGALTLTYEETEQPPPEYEGYVGNFTSGPVELGLIFNFMMQYMFIMMFFSMMTAAFSGIAEAMTV